MKHTPGPWYVGRDLENKCSAISTGLSDVIVGPCSVEDARLIGACPDMLEALEEYCADFPKTSKDYYAQYFRIVIAKARGES